MSRPTTKKYGKIKGEALVGCKTNGSKKYYIRNRYGAEIDIYPQDVDDLIEKLIILRNKTRRSKA